MAKIVVTDTDLGDFKYEEKEIQANGIDFAGYMGDENRKPNALIEHLKEADGAITSYGQFTAEVFKNLPQLKVVAKTGTGVDNIDIKAATANNTAVCNVVGYGTEVVSDHAIALALCSLRRINALDADMRSGNWGFLQERPLGQTSGRIFGVAGFGHIGHAVAKKANGLGFKVLVWDRSLKPGTVTDEGFQCVSLDDIISNSDVLSMHCALTKDTYHLIDASRIAKMKEDAILINTSRGSVVDTSALAQALQEGHLWGAGLDVFEEEPIDPNDPICKAPRTVLTPHAAYYSEESAKELRCRCTAYAINVVLGKQPENCVNPEVLDAAFAK